MIRDLFLLKNYHPSKYEKYLLKDLCGMPYNTSTLNHVLKNPGVIAGIIHYCTKILCTS
jgi:hypothetical protein